MDTYKRNLQAIKSVDLALFNALESVLPNENLEVFIGKDSADINFLDKQHNAFLFPDSSVTFSVDKVNEFNIYTLYPYLYFFGLGNGVFYKLFLNNKNLKRIIVVEPNIEILFSVLNLIDFSDEITSRLFCIMYSPLLKYENLSPFFHQNKNALLYSKLYNLHIFNDYYNIYIDEAMRINRLFIDIIEHGVISVGNDSKDAITGIKHHIANIPLMLESPSLIELIKKAKNTNTAIIVSTGPSLHKQLKLLKEIAPYVSIFCIDASFSILAKHDIKPDIVITMERVEAGAKFYDVVEKEKFHDVVFEITSIAHKKVIEAIQNKGGMIQFSQRPFGYTSYFELNEYGYVGIGMSAANMAYELVVHSGFEECILIGQDLAFASDGSSHSKDAVYGQDEIKNNKEKILLERYGGGGMVESTQIWKLFLNFFVKDIYDTKDRIKVINATEGGARIQGSIEMSFAKATKNISKNSPKKLIKLSYPSQETKSQNMQQARKKVQEMLEYGKEKKSQIEGLFLKVVGKTEELEKLKNENRLEEFDFSSLDGIFDEIEKIKELFVDKKFMTMFNEATQAFIFHQEMELAKITTIYTKDEITQKSKKLDWLFTHKAWLFSLAGCLDAVLFCVEDSAKSWM